MGRPWFRMYSEVLNDPKILRLTDKEFRVWVLCLCVAASADARMKEADLPLLLRRQPKALEPVLSSLVELGLLEIDGAFLEPHNWHGRQYESDVSTTRVKRFREQARNVSPAVSETPPDTEQIRNRSETETEAEQIGRLPLLTVAERSFGRMLSPTEIELLRALEEEHPYERIVYGFRVAAASAVKKMVFVKGVCEKEDEQGDSRAKPSRANSSKPAAPAGAERVAARIRGLG